MAAVPAPVGAPPAKAVEFPSVVDTVKASLLDAMRIAGEVLGMRVRIDGEAKAGANWKETH